MRGDSHEIATILTQRKYIALGHRQLRSWKNCGVESLQKGWSKFLICDIHDQGNESIVENANSYFLKPLSHLTPKCFILMQTPLQLDIWYYEEFVNDKNNIKHTHFYTMFLQLSQKTISPAYDSFLLIMSQIYFEFC